MAELLPEISGRDWARAVAPDRGRLDVTAGETVVEAARLRLLGGFGLAGRAGEEVELSSRRGCGLLAYLYLSPDRAARRERLYGLLWSDRGEAQARASLRQCLFELRQSLTAAGLDILQVGRDRVMLDVSCLGSDVADLEHALGGEDVPQMAAALSELERAQMLDGLELGGLYRDWLDQTRTRFEQSVAGAVHGQLRRLEAASRWTDVRAVAEAWLGRDPLDETAVAAAIRSDAVTGAAASAHRRFETLKSALAREFGVSPGPAVSEALTWVGDPGRTRPGGAGAAQHPIPVQSSDVAEVSPDPAPARTPQGERRHLTILSCGLAHGAEPGGGLDPEQWRAAAVEFRREVSQAVGSMGGHMAKARSDGLEIYFGYPEAREDAAECAVRAGLAALEAVAALNERLVWELSSPLHVRMGVHSGTVVVAPGAAGEEIEVFGDAPRIAQSVRLVAAPDSVVMSSSTHELVSGLFIVEDLGERSLREGADPVQLFRAARPGLMGRRGFTARGGAPFVGRDEELALLLGRWRRVREGEGQFVLVTGEPGIGKSRLVEEFRDRIKSAPHLWIECACGPLFTTTPLYPVIQLLQQGLGWQGDESPEERILRLEQALAPSGINLAEAVPLIAEMLNLSMGGRYPPLALSSDQRRNRLHAALTGWVFSASASQPLVVVVEDVQWVDPSSLEMIQTLAAQGAGAPLMVVCVARPEFRATWSARGHHAHLTLGRLNSRDAHLLVAGVASSTDLPGEVVERVIERSDGVPLFAEALTRLMLEGSGHAAGREIPATLLDSLAARLDRLGPAREVAQIAAVLGRDFTYPLIAAIADLPESELQAGLAKAADAELILARGHPPEATYQFRHALIQDAAYQALLKSQRRELHARVAETISARFAGLAELHPEVLARHWAEAGEAERAVSAWTEAGTRAASRAAHVEAAEHLGAALELVRRGPEDAARSAAELPLLLGLAVSLSASRGYNSPEVAEVLGQARNLCDQLGNVAGLFGVMSNICNFYSVAGQEEPAIDAAARCLRIAEETGRPDQLIQAHHKVGYMLYSQGKLAEAREHLELSAALYGEGLNETLTSYGPSDPRVEALSPQPIVLYAMGEAAEAARRSDEQLAHARALGSPYDLAYALGFRWVYETLAGKFEDALRDAEEIITLSEANGYPIWKDVGLGDKGLSLGRLGRFKEGREIFEAALAEQRRSGNVHALGLYLGEAARVYLQAGEAAAALETVDEALAWASRSYLFIQPRLHILRAEILTRANDKDQARSALEQALATAKAQGAKTFQAEAKAALAAV